MCNSDLSSERILEAGVLHNTRSVYELIKEHTITILTVHWPTDFNDERIVLTMKPFFVCWHMFKFLSSRVSVEESEILIFFKCFNSIFLFIFSFVVRFRRNISLKN